VPSFVAVSAPFFSVFLLLFPLFRFLLSSFTLFFLPPGFMPWFDVPGRQTAHVTVAFGHWSTLGCLSRPRLMALDTGCVWGGALSAVRIDGDGARELIQVPCPAAQNPDMSGD